jgi:hypothetical protein
MAWEARVLSKSLDPGDAHPVVSVGYFDSAVADKPTVVRTFNFAWQTTPEEAEEEIRYAGSVLEENHAQATELLAGLSSLPLGL